MKVKRSLWGTRFGFYLAAIGSAFGLGNLWRFPYVVAANGGGAFVLLYSLLALSFGISLLIGELMLGKLSRRSALVAVEKVMTDPILSKEPRPATAPDFILWKWVARCSMAASVLVLAYYAVISGWVLHFLMQMLFSEVRGEFFNPDSTLAILRENGLLQVLLTSAHLLLVLVVVVKGVQQGIEKWVSTLMPFFVILLIFLGLQSLSLPTAESAIRYLFYPDFSKLTSHSLLHAVGHVCFTLSIGFGTMVTFGSYLNPETRIPGAGLRVSVLDTVISLCAGLLIFPILVGSGLTVSGPEVLFQTLPKLFMALRNGQIFGIAFFLSLYLAALAASIGLLESIVANLLDIQIFKSRSLTTWVGGVAALLLAIVPALSTSLLSGVMYQGRGVLQLIDDVLINGILPIIAVGFCWIFSYYVKDEIKRSEFVNDNSQTTMKLFSHWLFVMKWLAPIIVIAAILLDLF